MCVLMYVYARMHACARMHTHATVVRAPPQPYTGAKRVVTSAIRGRIFSIVFASAESKGWNYYRDWLYCLTPTP